MPDIPDKPNYTHGSTGTAPASARNYQNGDPLDADNLDYYVSTPLVKINAIIDFLNAIDSNEDGKVDAAEQADSADTASLYKNNDIDTDGDGKVNAADQADSADTATKVKGNDIDSDGDGKVNAAEQADTANTATTATKVKGNDIDSDGDGKVNAAEQADNADTVDGVDIVIDGENDQDVINFVPNDQTYANSVGVTGSGKDTREDFESDINFDASFVGSWQGDTSFLSQTGNALEGTHSLQIATNTNDGSVYVDTTARIEQFNCIIYVETDLYTSQDSFRVKTVDPATGDRASTVSFFNGNDNSVQANGTVVDSSRPNSGERYEFTQSIDYANQEVTFSFENYSDVGPVEFVQPSTEDRTRLEFDFDDDGSNYNVRVDHLRLTLA